MKTNKSTNRLTAPTSQVFPLKLQRAFNRLLKLNKDDGTITLDELCGESDCDSLEVIDFLRNKAGRDGDFIAGRRGHPSRFVFGETFGKWVHSEQRRAEWRKVNGRDPLTGRLLKPARRPGRPAGSSRHVPQERGRTRHIRVPVGSIIELVEAV